MELHPAKEGSALPGPVLRSPALHTHSSAAAAAQADKPSVSFAQNYLHVSFLAIMRPRPPSHPSPCPGLTDLFFAGGGGTDKAGVSGGLL